MVIDRCPVKNVNPLRNSTAQVSERKVSLSRVYGGEINPCRAGQYKGIMDGRTRTNSGKSDTTKKLTSSIEKFINTERGRVDNTPVKNPENNSEPEKPLNRGNGQSVSGDSRPSSEVQTPSRPSETDGDINSKTVRRSPRVPFNRQGDRLSWNGEEILRNLSQRDNLLHTTTDDDRCAASSILAPAILQGPECTRRVAEGLRTDPDHVPEGDYRRREAIERDNELLEGIIGRINRRETTYNDLSLLQDIMYRSTSEENNDGNSRLSAETCQRLAGRAGMLNTNTEHPINQDDADNRDMRSLNRDIQSSVSDSCALETAEHTRRLIPYLNPGESILLGIDTDYDGTVNHAINVGATRGSNGQRRLYVYDPGRPDGQNLIYEDESPGLFNNYVYQSGRLSNGEYHNHRVCGVVTPQ